MNDYLAKPITREQLARALESNLLPLPGIATATHLAQDAPATADPEAAHKDAPATPLAFDPSVVQSLPMVADGSNPDFADRILDMFVATAGQILADIDLASRSDDAASLQRAAHTLKSSSATIGALALSEHASQLEMLLRAGSTPAADWPARIRCAYDEFAVALARHRAATATRKAAA